jgi:hypothetical protein
MQSGSRQNAWRIAYRLRCHHLPTRYLAAALKDRRGGWTAGTGVEYAFTDHIIGGLSYNYYEFPSDFRRRDKSGHDHLTPGRQHGPCEGQLQVLRAVAGLPSQRVPAMASR